MSHLHKMLYHWTEINTGVKSLSIKPRYSLFYPVCNDDTKDIECKFNRDELAARSVLGGFGCPDWGDCVQNSSADTIEDAGWQSEQYTSTAGG